MVQTAFSPYRLDRMEPACPMADASHERCIGVLVVEDSPLLLTALQRGLQYRGFAVWTATNGRDAVATYLEFGDQIDVVLSDVHMPVMDGFETLDAVRQINPGVRFCFMSGDTQSSTFAELLRLGALKVFPKPLASVFAVADELRELADKPMLFMAAVERMPDDGPGRAFTPVPIRPQEPRLHSGILARFVAQLLAMMRHDAGHASSARPACAVGARRGRSKLR